MADPVSMLKSDHVRIRAILHELLETTERGGKIREKLVAQLEMELMIHTKVEEETFYPAFKALALDRDDRMLFFRAAEEHHNADVNLVELKRLETRSEQFTAKCEVIYNLLEAHLKMEEKEMFIRYKELTDPEHNVKLYDRMVRRRETLEAQWKSRLMRPIKRAQTTMEAFVPAKMKALRADVLGGRATRGRA
ncbi:MAG: hemerythrin domain-containing protein [Myxococcota bacterium]